MKKYKLHKEEPEVTEQEINKYKDFSRFKANYEGVVRDRHKLPLYKNKKMLLALLMLLMIIWLLMKSDKKEPDIVSPTNTEQVD
ncbi:MAG: hypothetical protein JKY42_03505 [Flavobacteriales bacterium]|nr:hypothetical protein [Flavobacteriales bacterium]